MFVLFKLNLWRYSTMPIFCVLTDSDTFNINNIIKNCCLLYYGIQTNLAIRAATDNDKDC